MIMSTPFEDKMEVKGKVQGIYFNSLVGRERRVGKCARDGQER